LKVATDISVVSGADTINLTTNVIGSIPPYGIIVAYAEESIDASAEDKPIMVRLVI